MSVQYPPGTVFKRRKPLNDSLDEIRVVGGGKTLVVTSNLQFEGQQVMDFAVLRTEYLDGEGAEIPEPVMDDNAKSKMTPEEVFAAEAAAAAIEVVPKGGKRVQTT
jgi:hypothetical protein